MSFCYYIVECIPKWYLLLKLCSKLMFQSDNADRRLLWLLSFDAIGFIVIFWEWILILSSHGISTWTNPSISIALKTKRHNSFIYEIVSLYNMVLKTVVPFVSNALCMLMYFIGVLYDISSLFFFCFCFCFFLLGGSTTRTFCFGIMFVNWRCPNDLSVQCIKIFRWMQSWRSKQSAFEDYHVRSSTFWSNSTTYPSDNIF